MNAIIMRMNDEGETWLENLVLLLYHQAMNLLAHSREVDYNNFTFKKHIIIYKNDGVISTL